MTYVVNESCIKCKYMDCVEVCPVDCFYEGENMLVIHPDECIDCGVCEPECPVEAIKPDTEPGLEKWLELNAEYAKTWPNITVKREPPADAKEWEGVPDKFKKFFSPSPARATEPRACPSGYRQPGVSPACEINRSAQIAGFYAGVIALIATHKALILAKNVLYMTKSMMMKNAARSAPPLGSLIFRGSTQGFG